MARVTRNIVNAVSYPTLQPAADSLDIAFTAADTVNFEQTPMTAPFILFFWNSGGVSATVTINSVADTKRRTGDITTYSLAAGDISAVAFPSTEGWKQADGNLYYQASSNIIKFAAVGAPQL
jgi:hypothetical protein